MTASSFWSVTVRVAGTRLAEPTYITNLVSNSVAEIRDDDRFDALDARETTDRELLDQAAREWSTVVSYLNGG